MSSSHPSVNAATECDPQLTVDSLQGSAPDRDSSKFVGMYLADPDKIRIFEAEDLRKFREKKAFENQRALEIRVCPHCLCPIP